MTITGIDSDQPVSFHGTPGDAPHPRAVITCRVCGRRQNVALTNAVLLCTACRADPQATRRHVERQQHQLEHELDTAWQVFGTHVAGTSIHDQQRYSSLIGTLAGLFTRRRDDPAAAGRIWRAWVAASLADDGLARMLIAERVLWDAVWRVRTRRIHLARAHEECLLARELREQHGH